MAARGFLVAGDQEAPDRRRRGEDAGSKGICIGMFLGRWEALELLGSGDWKILTGQIMKKMVKFGL